MISAADLPLNSRGAVYHLDLLPEELADTIITVGDPRRTSMISKHFDSIEYIGAHREFITHTGYVGKKRISVVSTGIGVPPIDIVMTELDALANIDLSTKLPHSNLKSLNIIRLGTTGCLQAYSNLGDILLTQFAIGFDNLMDYYQRAPNETLNHLRAKLTTYLSGECSSFYLSETHADLLKIFGCLGECGITATCDGFYGPQGRMIRVPLRYPNLMEKLVQFEFANLKVINFEMETAGILGLGQVMGHRCISLSTVIANRVLGTFAADFEQKVEQLIQSALPIIAQL